MTILPEKNYTMPECVIGEGLQAPAPPPPGSCAYCEGDVQKHSQHSENLNDSNVIVWEILQNLLTAEAVRNKDRMAVEPLLELMPEKLIDFLNSMKDVFVTMNVLPDRYRISESSKRGVYEHPFAISTADTGKVIFLN